jgi:hypothetical protein
MSKFQFHPKEFTQMLYNVEKIPEGTSILQYYKDLNKIREMKLDPGVGIDNNLLLIYIILMYDKSSPYRKKYPDILRRKIEVAHDVGFETIEGGEFDAPIEDFLRGKNRMVNQKIVQYVRHHKNYKYAYQVSIEASYSNLMLDIQGGETKSISEARKLRDELEENLLELLNQDNNPYLRDEILRYMEDERLALRPEDIAKKLQNGEPPITKKAK